MSLMGVRKQGYYAKCGRFGNKKVADGRFGSKWEQECLLGSRKIGRKKGPQYIVHDFSIYLNNVITYM